MAQSGTSDSAGVILNPAHENGRRRRVRARRWAVTSWGTYDTTYVSLLNSGWKFVIGRETCPTTGKEHNQIYIEHEHPIDFNALKEVLGKDAHLEVCKGSKEENIKYCIKGDDYKMKGLFYEQPSVIKILRPWQEKIYQEMMGVPNDRTINWIVDIEGNGGKTAFAKYCLYHRLAMYLTSGKANDIKNLVLNLKECRDFIIDLSRSVEEHVSYTVLEELKNGVIVSGKYEGGIKMISTPHVYVFANFEPCRSKLSLDRWNVRFLHKGELVEYDDMY